MVLFDRFDPSNFNVEVQAIDASPRTTSELRREYPEMGTLKTWPLGIQEASETLGVISRTYKELTFDTDAKDFDFNDAGFEDDTYGGRYFWRVILGFTETEHYSDSSLNLQDFKCWEESTNKYQLDIIYKHEVTSTVTWNRPKTDIPAEFTPPPMMGGMGTYGCSGMGTDETPTETGSSDSFYVTVLDEGESPNDPTNDLCRSWHSLAKPFSLIFDSGRGLGATLDTDFPPDRILFKSLPTDPTGDTQTHAGTFADPYRMKKRYLVLEWDNPGKGHPDGLTYATVEFYGVEFYRSFLPLSVDQDPIITEHPAVVEKILHVDELPNPKPITRLKPPTRQDFPDGFWNDQQIDPVEQYGVRIGVEPSVTEG